MQVSTVYQVSFRKASALQVKEAGDWMDEWMGR